MFYRQIWVYWKLCAEIVVGVDAVKGAGVVAHLGAGVVERGASIVEGVSACVIEGLAAGIRCIASGVLIL